MIKSVANLKCSPLLLWDQLRTNHYCWLVSFGMHIFLHSRLYFARILSGCCCFHVEWQMERLHEWCKKKRTKKKKTKKYNFWNYSYSAVTASYSIAMLLFVLRVNTNYKRIYSIFSVFSTTLFYICYSLFITPCCPA